MQKYLQRKDVPDLETFWLLKQAEYLKRIENPPFCKMDNYLKPHISQEDFNFFCEMEVIREEYTDHMAEINCVLDPPVVLTDPVNRHILQLLCVIRSKALSEELKRIL